MPLPAPQLLFRSPAPGEEQPLDAPIELTFDQPMDRDSVEAAFTISPTVEGEFTWLDDRTLAFDPQAELERGARYRVTVDATAENVEGKPLEEPASFEFGTVGFLEVSQVMPSPDSDELDPDTVVTVVFNRPVVPLTAISRQGELPQPLTFVPPVRGRGEWLNTSIYHVHAGRWLSACHPLQSQGGCRLDRYHRRGPRAGLYLGVRDHPPGHPSGLASRRISPRLDPPT